MAEIAQHNLEKAIGELEQLKRIKLFTSEEIRDIVKAKRKNEYCLQKPEKRKEDFLRYIKSEVELLKKIRKRRKKANNQYKKKEIDDAIIKRIKTLYKRAIFTFHNDLSIWEAYIEFCNMTKNKKLISGIYTRLLQLHPDKEYLWVKWGLWELQENKALENARKIFHNALKYHCDSPLLYHEYFFMELEAVRLISLNKEEIQNSASAFMAFEIAKAIYQEALEKIPESKMPQFDVCVNFLKRSQKFDYADQLSDFILDDIKSKFNNDERVYELTAKLTMEKNKIEALEDFLTKIIPIYEEGVSKLKSEKMWSFYITSILDVQKKCISASEAVKACTQTLTLMQRAYNENCLSCELFIEQVQLLRLLKEDTTALCKEGIARWPQCEKLWLLYVDSLPTDDKDRFNIYKDALRNLSESKVMCLKFLLWASTFQPQKLEDVFDLCQKHSAFIAGGIQPLFLDLFSKTNSIGKTRKYFNKIKILPNSNKPELLKVMINIEKSLPEPSKLHLRQLFEEATSKYGSHDVLLWLDYMNTELEFFQDFSRYAIIKAEAEKRIIPEKHQEFVVLSTNGALSKHSQLFS